jgi:hypothetical protein
MNDLLALTEIVPGLYMIGRPSAGQATWVYYLLQKNLPAPAPPPTLDETWTSADAKMNGWYLYVDAEISKRTAEAFVNSAREKLQPLQPSGAQGGGYRQIVWLSSRPTSSSDSNPFPYQFLQIFLQVLFGSFRYSWKTNTLFQWSSLGLEAVPSFGIQLQQSTIFNLTSGVFQIWATTSSVQVNYGPPGSRQQQNVGVYSYQFPSGISGGPGWLFQIPLSGPAAGSLCFGVGLDPGWLYSFFGCWFQLNYGTGGSLAYLIFPPAQPAVNTANYLGFQVRFHPLFPRNPSCTRLALDLSGTGPGKTWSTNSLALRSAYFFTTAGVALTLQPCRLTGKDSPESISSPIEVSPPGFAFAMRPPVGSPGVPWVHYLTPMGHFQVSSGTSPASGSLDIMGGLFAEEYLHTGIGDWVEFAPGMAAFAPGFQTGASASPGPASPDEQPALIDTFTTSWVKYPSGPANDVRGYFSQASSSVYYGQAGAERFPRAVSALFSRLESTQSFPIMPYGGIYASWDNKSSPNQQVPAEVFATFESQVLTSARHTNITPNPTGAIFLPPRAGNEKIVAAGAAFELAAAMATTHTPQGLLVKLNQGGSPAGPAGTWNTLFLAVSPDQGSPAMPAVLSIEGVPGSPVSEVVDPVLSSVLMKNQLFLVVSNPFHLQKFNNEINLGGFNFQLDVGPSETLLIFKFNTSASLAQLAEQPNLWAGTRDFVDDVPEAQKAIRKAIRIANEHAGAMGHPFLYFSQIAAQQEWTGILALNCAINGNGMPLDFQMLLGGIKGQLRAHHFGIELNKVQAGSADPGLDQSSLFGVIYYENPGEFASPEPDEEDLDYEVETLTVVFSNSVITQFGVQVGLTINRLFGRETKLAGSATSPPPRNTLVIAGQYQKHGTVGTVTFSSDTPFVYEFPAVEGSTRVIKEVLINQASLVPVSSTVTSPGTLVKANFLMAGQVFFHPDPFPHSDGLDLFSYGTSGASATGIAFSGLTANISFVLNAAGEMDAGTKSVTANWAPFTFTPAAQAIRPNSLMGSLPLQFSRFVYSETGITQSMTGASPIQVLQLEGSQQSGSPAPPASSPYGTTNPLYGLEYDLPLGSLGSLSDVGVGIMAKLLLAWGPSQVVPDNDGAAVLVQLPALTAGLFGFTLQGILQTTFGDANLLKVDLDSGEAVYAILFNNIKLSVFGFSFPPGLVVDFTLFAGTPESGAARNTSNIGWFLAAYQT